MIENEKIKEILKKILSKKELTEEELNQFQTFVEDRYVSYMDTYQSGDMEKLQNLLNEDKKIRNIFSRITKESITTSAIQFVQIQQIFEDLYQFENNKNLFNLCKKLHIVLQIIDQQLYTSKEFIKFKAELPEKKFDRIIHILEEGQYIHIFEQENKEQIFLTHQGKRLLLRLEKIINISN